MNTFQKSKTIDTPTVGRELCNFRTEKSMSIDELAEKTKVPPRYLRSLEKGDLHALPAPVYTRGILRRAAHVLQQDPRVLLSLYERDRRLSEHLEGSSSHEDHALGMRTTRSFTITPRAISLGAVLLLVVTTVIYLGVQIDDLLSPPNLLVDQPSGNEVLLSTVVTVVGQTEPGVTLTINGEEVYVGDQGFFAVELPVQEGINRLRIQAQNRFGQISEVVRQVVVPISE